MMILMSFLAPYFDASFIAGYIDPGTGSIILQAIIGGIAAGLIAVRLFWHRILRFFGVKQKTAPEEEE